MKIELKQRILNDKYTAYVYEAFDIQNKDATSDATINYLNNGILV